jgi:hypothetical protein
MLRDILLILWFSFVFAASYTKAQELPTPESFEAPCAPDVPEELRRATIERNHAIGVWFHADLARCMLTRLQMLPAYARSLQLLEQRVTLSDERDQLRQREVSIATEQATVANNALEAAVRRAQAAEAERDAWYRAPLLWFVLGSLFLGALLGGVAGVAEAFR